jgi:serine/threonine protein kinase
MKKIIDTDTDTIYWHKGNLELIKNIIAVANSNSNKNILGSGSFSTVIKVTIEGKDYTVKIFNKDAYTDELTKTTMIKNELATAENIEGLIPDYVTPLVGGAMNFTDDKKDGYIIYKYIKGKILTELLKDLKAQNLSPTENHKILSSLFWAMRDAIESLNAKGFSHGDIKPDNLYFVMDEPRPKCKLIDFGFTTEHGEILDTYTEEYSPKNWPIEQNVDGSPFDYNDMQKEFRELSPKFNRYSSAVIWYKDMVQGFPGIPTEPLPRSATGGGRKTRRRRQRKTRV